MEHTVSSIDVRISRLYTLTNQKSVQQLIEAKKMPYLYTQCEDIAYRSVDPMQDTPANKIIYNANVTVSKEFKKGLNECQQY